MRRDFVQGKGFVSLSLDLGEEVIIQTGRLAACDPSIQPSDSPGLFQRALLTLSGPKKSPFVRLGAMRGVGRVVLASAMPGELFWLENAEGMTCRLDAFAAWTGEDLDEKAGFLKGRDPARHIQTRGKGDLLVSACGGGEVIALAHGQTLKVDSARLAAWEVSLSEKKDSLGMTDAVGPGRIVLTGAIPETPTVYGIQRKDKR